MTCTGQLDFTFSAAHRFFHKKAGPIKWSKFEEEEKEEARERERERERSESEIESESIFERPKPVSIAQMPVTHT